MRAVSTPNIDEYVDCALQFWDALARKGAKAANRISARSGRIVKSWEAAGDTVHKLEPLLTHDSEAVRYAAAADLFTRTRSVRAADTLRALSGNGSGLIAPTARLLLETHATEHGASDA